MNLDAARIAAAMGGSIAVASDVGCGSRFTVRLPAATTGVGEPGRAVVADSEVRSVGGGVR